MAQIDFAALKKGGFMRQKQKNMFSLRLQVVGGELTAENLKKISEVAEKYGKGYVHLTSRQGVEIPFINFNDIEEVKEQLSLGGCKPGVCGPRVRTVTACQGNAVCPSGNIDTKKIADELNERYFGRELPHKFKFGVTGCQNNCLKAEENDVGIKGALDVKWVKEDCINCSVCIKACRNEAIHFEGDDIILEKSKCNYCGRCVKSCPTSAWVGDSAYLVSFGGTFGNSIVKGDEYLPPITSTDDLFKITDATIDFFAEYANPSERFRKTIDRVGADKLKQKLEQALA